MERSGWELRNGHRGGIIWFTGLSGSGKTTLAAGVERRLVERDYRCIVIDGDRLRAGLIADLGFTEADRWENLRRAAEVADLFISNGFIVLVPMITPLEDFRRRLKQRFQPGDFAEIYIRCSLEACERRDPKGLYRKARTGVVKQFTGLDSPYEPPENPDVILDTEKTR